MTEGVEVSDQAVELVARRAGGSMRDSPSLFDQLLGPLEGGIDVEDVHRLLGTALMSCCWHHDPWWVGSPIVRLEPLRRAPATGAQQEELLGHLSSVFGT
ncbi:MAG: hypothetical protein CM1200mP2_54360 [Planctomycetaceae bacterium]|nr:MAG: hypothetical protein CM1200mP2_54360 [Planctomycetaceae bacterium]